MHMHLVQDCRFTAVLQSFRWTVTQLYTNLEPIYAHRSDGNQIPYKVAQVLQWTVVALAISPGRQWCRRQRCPLQRCYPPAIVSLSHSRAAGKGTEKRWPKSIGQQPKERERVPAFCPSVLHSASNACQLSFNQNITLVVLTDLSSGLPQMGLSFSFVPPMSLLSLYFYWSVLIFFKKGTKMWKRHPCQSLFEKEPPCCSVNYLEYKLLFYTQEKPECRHTSWEILRVTVPKKRGKEAKSCTF